MLLFSVVILGCTFREMPDSTGPAGTTTEPTVTIADPTLGDLTVGDCAAAPSTLKVTFNTPNPTVAVVEFGPTSAYGYSSVPGTDPKTDHHIQVPGFPGGAEWHWRIRVEGVDGPYTTPDQTFTGGSSPPEIPEFDIGVKTDGAYTPGFRVAPGLSDPDFLTVVNDDGQSVWWQTFDHPYAATQARVDTNGAGISYLLQDYTRETDLGEIVHRDWCGDIVDDIPAPWGHHDYVVLPWGGYAFVAADIREFMGTSIVGDAVMEMAADGTGLTSVWSTWDNLEMTLAPDCEVEFYPQGCDWTHGNGVYYDADEDAYYYSSHALSSVVRFDRNGGGEGAGVNRWVVGTGSPDATLEFAETQTEWMHQHGFKAVGNNEYVVFDNGSGGTTPSEVRRVAVDEAAGVVSTVWNYRYDSQHTSQLLGDVQLLANGNYYIGWGSEAEITEVTPDEEVVWQVGFDLGVALAFTNHVEQIGGEQP